MNKNKPKKETAANPGICFRLIDIFEPDSINVTKSSAVAIGNLNPLKISTLKLSGSDPNEFLVRTVPAAQRKQVIIISMSACPANRLFDIENIQLLFGSK